MNKRIARNQALEMPSRVPNNDSARLRFAKVQFTKCCGTHLNPSLLSELANPHFVHSSYEKFSYTRKTAIPNEETCDVIDFDRLGQNTTSMGLKNTFCVYPSFHQLALLASPSGQIVKQSEPVETARAGSVGLREQLKITIPTQWSGNRLPVSR